MKRISRELVVTKADDPCDPVDGFFFIWTSMKEFGCRYKRIMTSRRAIKREDEAMDGYGEVTMKTHEKNVMDHFACKWASSCKTW